MQVETKEEIWELAKIQAGKEKISLERLTIKAIGEYLDKKIGTVEQRKFISEWNLRYTDEDQKLRSLHHFELTGELAKSGFRGFKGFDEFRRLSTGWSGKKYCELLTKAYRGRFDKSE